MLSCNKDFYLQKVGLENGLYQKHIKPKKTIYFALSSELSCSEQGYTFLEETESPKGVKITYHSVCD